MGRQLGVSHVAVLNAARDGRIPRNADGTFVPARVRSAWARNTDTTKPRNRITGNPKGNGHAPGAVPPDSPAGVALSRSVKALYEARLAEHEFNVKTGKVIEREAVERWVVEVFMRLRDRLTAIPDRLDAIMAAEIDRRRDSTEPTAPSETHKMLTEEITSALAEMSGAPLP